MASFSRLDSAHSYYQLLEEAIDELRPFEGQSGKVCYVFVQNFSDKTYDN